MIKQRAPPDARIQKMREIEDRLNKMQQLNKEEKHFSAVATWEQKTSEKIKSNVVQQRFEALKARREANLDARRRQLGDKLAAEDAQLKQELIASQETPEQRRSKLAARARALASTREAERQALATQLLDRAFQEKCDVLRDANSKRILYRTIDERNAQIEQKMATRILEEEEKRMFHEMNEVERLKAEQRHADDKRRDLERRHETVRVLEEQVRAVEARRAEEAAAHAAEVESLTAEWARIAQEQEAAEAADRERMKQLAAELFEFNKIKRLEISEAERTERELDLRILQEALAKEADEEAREAAARERRQQDVLRYRKQLALMMQKDAEDQGERDAMIQQAFLAQQAKRDAELEAREEARRRLMAEVDAIRQEQIRDKELRRQQDIAEMQLERERLLQDEAVAASEAVAHRVAERRRALERRLEIQTQMVAKAHIKAAEEDEKLRELELGQAAETAYIGRVKDMLGATDPPKWYGRRKFDWYS